MAALQAEQASLDDSEGREEEVMYEARSNREEVRLAVVKQTVILPHRMTPGEMRGRARNTPQMGVREAPTMPPRAAAPEGPTVQRRATMQMAPVLPHHHPNPPGKVYKIQR